MLYICVHEAHYLYNSDESYPVSDSHWYSQFEKAQWDVGPVIFYL